MRLLERDRPLAELRELLDGAGQGSGRVALVRGEAGIGKTSLTRRFVAEVGADAHVLWGSCDDLVTPHPLGALRDMAVDEPELSAAFKGDDRNDVFQVALNLLSRSLRPTVMVIEDIHWADDATLDLIRFLGRRIGRANGLLVLTYRDTDVPANHPLRSVLGDMTLIHRIQLAPLSREAVGELIGPEGVADEVFDLTAGNPFFVVELNREGQEIPRSISDSLSARVGRLSPGSRRLVELLSTIPGGAELEFAFALHDDAQSAISEALQAGILILDGHVVRFRHELARRALEADLAAVERRQLNREILSALELTDSNLASRAHHAREAGDVEALLDTLPAAAREAAVSGSHRQALEHLDALEPYLDRLDLEDLAGHYELWAWEAHWVGEERAFGLVEMATELRRRLGDPIALGRWLLDGAVIVTTQPGAVAVREAMVDEALQLLEGSTPENVALAHARMSRLRLSAYDFEGAMRHAGEALAIDGAPPAARVEALMNVGWVLLTTNPPQGMAEMEQAFRLAGRAGLRDAQLRVAMNLVARMVPLRRLAEAERWTEEAVRVAENIEVPVASFQIDYHRAAVAIRRGDWDTGERLTLQAMDRYEWNHPGRFTIGAELGAVKVRRGDPEALPLLMELWQQAHSTGDVMKAGPVSTPVSERIWLAGDVPPDVVAQVVELFDRVLANNEGWNAGELGQYLYLAGHLEGVSVPLPEPFQYLFDGDWTGAARFWEERGYPYERAVALSLGDVEARMEALRILDDLGAAALSGKVRKTLRAEGVKGIPRGPYRGRRSSPQGLTPRQTEILDLLADDLSNADIADRLFLSVRTVENHVSSILTTLGAGSRVEAVRIARAGSS